MTDEDQIQRILNQHQENQVLQDFNDHLVLTLDTTYEHHHYRNLNNLKIMQRELPELNWQDLGESDVKKLLVYIEDRDIEPETKNKYRAALKKYLEMQDKNWENLAPKGVTVYQETEDKHTDPEKIPDPEEVKKFLKEVETRSRPHTRLRNIAFFFTLWDTGARSNGLKKSPLEYEVHDKYVTVTIYPTKESPKRKVDCAFAAPILKKYLDNHPNPETGYLFPRIEKDRQNASQSTHSKDHVNADSMRSLANSIWQDLTESQVVDVDYHQQPLHIFRKSMKTWFNNMEIVNETDIDVRAGHVIGSDYTRVYTRKSDEDSNRSMRKNLGIEEDDDRDWRKVLWPKTCDSCGILNSGHRDLCNQCGTSLTEKAYPYGDVKKQDGVGVDVQAKIQSALLEDPDKSLNQVTEEIISQIQEGN